jgi:NAD/NADP octopine/nopaline dehydrogenase, alpha-helical domain
VNGAALTICGSGNGGHALAVAASENLASGAIDWLVRSEDRADLLRRGVFGPGLHSTGVISHSAHRLRTISADPAEVIPNAEMVVIVVPAYAHAGVLQRIAPYVTEGTALGCLPTRGGFEFEAAGIVANAGGTPSDVFGLQTLPWSTRVATPGEVVHIGAQKAEVVVAALPTDGTAKIAERLSQILGTEVVATQGFLGLTLGNPGQFIHAGLMYGHFHSWRGDEYDEASIPMLYAQASDAMGRVVEQLSNEAIAVAHAIDESSAGLLDMAAVQPIHAWLKAAYSRVTGDTSTVASCFRTGPIQARKAPMLEVAPGRFLPNFHYRYLSEDVPFGLVATRALAELANVDTPMIDEVIGWAQSAMTRVYLVGGRVAGPDAKALPIPQNHGISTLSELIRWYSDHGAAVSEPLAASRTS